MKKDRPILNSKTRIWLHFYLSTAYISGGMICFLPYFFPEMVGGQENLRSTLWAGGLLFFLGMSIVLLQAVKHEKIKDILILAVMLFSIPVVTLGFIEYAGITVWAFPAVLMFASLVFNTRVPLILITAMSVVTQLLVWINVPVKSVQVDEFDYVMRIGIYIIALWLGLFINRVYIERLKENSRQIEFQKLISDISFDFISVSQLNFDGNINAVLKKTGLFFKVDRTYIFLLNSQDSTINYACEWCREGGAPERERVQQVPLETFPWGMEQLRGNKLIYIKDVDKLPDEAAPEKEQLIRRGVKSAVIIPIVENGEILGVMGFDSLLSHKSWPDEYIQMLKILSNLLANGLLKIKSKKKLNIWHITTT
ncbi:MAG: GAF domain-containing protein [Lacrimispora sp.]